MSDGKRGAAEALERITAWLNLRYSHGILSEAAVVRSDLATMRAHIAAQDAELARLRREASRDEQRAEEMQGMLADARADVERLREFMRDAIALANDAVKEQSSDKCAYTSALVVMRMASAEARALLGEDGK